ncbi:DNA topoisomerase IB [Kitasatospora cheerisanensis]|uniref:DNA topoisomerase n=1 Tax=Kitasatospora cheerisanensis KCTC 2395 TaxID=1348663 RepID=A0A066ZBQ1_9ACTN|nr:DNA topoisomerase [Kitasatospora cheerisanensis KCTC 2395]
MRHGRGFGYRDVDGAVIRDPAVRRRLAELAVPPAWTEVWICPDPRGHLQAVGTDAAGRRQYLYHPEFRARQEAAKHAHVLAVAERLPAVRTVVAEDLGRRGLCRARVLAAAARLLDLGLFRSGSSNYVEENGSYGLTTLLREQVAVRGERIRFEYPAKSGRHRELTVVDRECAAVVRSLLRRRDPAPALWAYWEGGQWHPVDADALNAYLREASGTDLTAKDHRTWHATVLAAVGLAVSWPQAARSAAERRRAAARVVREVAGYLGNTPAVCRASYLNPALFERFDRGITVADALPDLGAESPHPGPGLPGIGPAVERAVARLLAD